MRISKMQVQLSVIELEQGEAALHGSLKTILPFFTSRTMAFSVVEMTRLSGKWSSRETLSGR
jgi:hypothetical protein